MQNYKPLENILWKTPEGIACKKAIEYFDAHFDEWSINKRQKNIKIFAKKFDEPLNERWEQLKKQYQVKKK